MGVVPVRPQAIEAVAVMLMANDAHRARIEDPATMRMRPMQWHELTEEERADYLVQAEEVSQAFLAAEEIEALSQAARAPGLQPWEWGQEIDDA